MSFLRPELAAALGRNREAIVWGGALVAGIGLAWRGYARLEPLALAVGTGLAVAGFALLRGALIRRRLAAAPGPGVVVIDEGRIGLLGPDRGGFVDLPALVSVAVTAPAGGGGRAWVLRAEDGTELAIPFGASGADGLPDALAALPGIDFALAERSSAVLWRRAPPRADRRRLPGA